MRHVVVVLLLASLEAASEDIPRPICRENTNCTYKKYTQSDKMHYYTVDGIEVRIKDQATTLFYLKCFNQSISVDNINLPTMTQLKDVEKVEITNCLPPLKDSYANALQAMNFKATRLKSLILTDPYANLTRQHLADLPINELSIIYGTSLLYPTENFLDGLSQLRSLELKNVILKPEALMRLPKNLEILKLHNANPTASSELGNDSAWLEGLSSLHELELNENYETKSLTLPKFELLPNLTSLKLSYIPLNTEGLAGKLKGSSIKHLVMRSCNLTNLPDKMFEGANLTTLDLSCNNLTVEKCVFSPLQWLTKLDLGDSQVDYADLVNIVSPLTRLKKLKASNNPLQGSDDDICSNVTWPKSLHNLDLSTTHVTRICPDWIDNDALLDINLSNNDITYLNYNHLKMKRAKPTAVVTINLTGNPSLRIINVSSADIEQCCKDFTLSPDFNNRQRTKVILKLSDSLSEAQCDYDAYMLHEAVPGCSWLQFNKDIFKNIRFKYTPLKHNEILCPYSGTCLTGCTCKKRPRDNVTVIQECKGPLPQTQRWPRPLLEEPLALYVENIKLDRVPDAVLVELHAPHNNITDLNNLPDTLLELDVRYNNIRHISEEVARNLSKIGTNRSVHLEGNRLACNCSDAPALELLKHVVRDLNTTPCADGVVVLEKMQFLKDQCAFPMLPILLSLLSIVLVLLVVWLLLHRFKPQIRQVLFKLNWGRRFIFRVKDDDAEKTVDVFLSYAYCDLEVLQILKNGLEARGYSTLEHNRDWHPGVSILDQIVVSVKCARRTLLLVSDNYADSPWAVKEFHTAHAHAMERQTARVLVVRYNLQQSERLPPDLQLYLKYNTYLDWHDDNFWVKLCRAMPMHFQINNQ